ncbi:MAG: RDD family protein, partial [Solirubrobacterales bacterium]|nr:RDD family protein [Solirubrobacterales bacterium]
LGSILSALAIYIGYLWMLWDGERQTWHDKFVHSVVVPESAYPLR